MKITPQQLVAFSSGLSTSKPSTDLWHPKRMPDSFHLQYHDDPNALERFACTSGVRFRFASDTTGFDVEIGYDSPVREYFTSVLRVDQQTVITSKPTTGQSQQIQWRCNAPTIRMFDLWLPHLCRSRIVTASIDDGASIEPVPLDMNWIAFGDSITQGMTTPLPTDTYVGRCTLAWKADTLNLGFGGAVLNNKLSHAVQGIHARADLITVAFGTNDFLKNRSLSDMEDCVGLLYQTLRNKWRNAQIAFISPPPWINCPSVNKIGNQLNDYRECIRRIMQKHRQAHYIDGRDLIPSQSQYFTDGIHPNTKGFARYARNLQKYLHTLNAL